MSNQKTKWGVMLARFQPIHNGHLHLIEQAVNENDKVLLIIGSANKINERNPIPISFRQELVEQAIAEKFTDEQQAKIVIMPLDDLTSEIDNSVEWGYYLHMNIAEAIGTVFFTMYYSDGWEIVMEWFPAFIRNNYVSFKLNARGNILNNLSATKVRGYILDDDKVSLAKSVPNCVLNNANALKHYIKATKITKE